VAGRNGRDEHLKELSKDRLTSSNEKRTPEGPQQHPGSPPRESQVGSSSQGDVSRRSDTAEQSTASHDRWSPALEILEVLAGKRKVPAPSGAARVGRAAKKRAFVGDREDHELRNRIAELERKQRRAQVRTPQVALRDTVIWQLRKDPDLQRPKNKQIAARLTGQGIKPPEHWGVKTFNEAYRDPRIRPKFNKMISAAKPT
jgi:hypothetical protein